MLYVVFVICLHRDIHSIAHRVYYFINSATQYNGIYVTFYISTKKDCNIFLAFKKTYKFSFILMHVTIQFLNRNVPIGLNII